MGLRAKLAKCFTDRRQAALAEHSLPLLLRQRVAAPGVGPR